MILTLAAAVVAHLLLEQVEVDQQVVQEGVEQLQPFQEHL